MEDKTQTGLFHDMNDNTSQNQDKLYSSDEIRHLLFSENSRPSHRTWERYINRGLIPHIRLCGKKLFDLQKVREALSKLEVCGKNVASF
jgi:LPS sulfotransferase NodH